MAVVVENGGFGATYAGPIASLIAEQYLTGTIERKAMEESIIKADFKNEYLRQWNDYLKRTGKYIPTNLPQSLKDSINKIKVNKKLIAKEKQRLIQNIISKSDTTKAKILDNFMGD